MEIKDGTKFAKVHSTDTFGTVDGPGIRFLLFLQGCSLQCKYCHNRDTWDMLGGDYQSLDSIFNKIIKYKEYITPNGGGITVSGGEPLLQSKFLIELFSRLKNENIHTCIDTSGMLPLTEDIKKVLSLTDLVLLDIKHINSKKCEELVGFPNKLELQFAKYLSDNNISMWIRQVIIPGITDDEKDLKKLKEFLNSLNTVEKIELLPYHTLGKHKWKDLGLKYDLDGIPDATDKDIQRAKGILGLT